MAKHYAQHGLTTLIAWAVLGIASLPASTAGAQGPPVDCSWDATIGQPGMNAAVWTLTPFDDGAGTALYAGGAFSTAGGQAANHVARWDGEDWHPVGEGMGGVTSPVVHALVEFDDGSGPALYAGGAFTTADGKPASRIARWDGVEWAPLGDGLGNTVRALAVFDDGDGPALYAGGTFQSAGGEPIVGVARWDGEAWSALGTGLGGGLPYVYAFTAFDDGSGPALYVGGTFITAGGKPATNIARWDGEEWSDVGGGVNQWVTALTVFDDGNGPALYAGGALTTAGGQSALRVARWDGKEWSALGTGVSGDFPWVEALAGFDEGNGSALHVGGWFEVAGGQPASRIARWDGEEWSALSLGLNERVWDLLEFDGGGGNALYVAGHFTTAGIYAANRIARWVCEPGVAFEADPSRRSFVLASYPNPASDSVVFTFSIAQAGSVRLVVLDLIGRQVAAVHEGVLQAGRHALTWTTGGVAPGTYVLHLSTGDSVASRRFVVVR